MDGQPIFRVGLRQILESAGYIVVAETDSAKEAVRALELLSPHLVVLDLDIAHGDGIELVRQMVSLQEDLPILVITHLAESQFAERLLNAGACGFLSKRSSPDVVLDGVRRAMEGDLVFSESVVKGVLQNKRSTRRKKTSELDQLSDREFQIFRYLAEGITCREVAERMGLSCKTVQTYCERIKVKMNFRSQQQLVAAAAQQFGAGITGQTV